MVKKRRTAKPKVVSTRAARKKVVAAKKAIRSAKKKIAAARKTFVKRGFQWAPGRTGKGQVVMRRVPVVAPVVPMGPKQAQRAMGSMADKRVVVAPAVLPSADPPKRRKFMGATNIPVTTDPRVYPDMPGMLL